MYIWRRSPCPLSRLRHFLGVTRYSSGLKTNTFLPPFTFATAPYSYPKKNNVEVESTQVNANSFLVLIQRSQSTACKHAWSINLKLQHSLSNVQSVICTTQQGKSAKQTKRYLFDAELSLLIIRKFGSHEAFSESTLSYRRSQYVISIFFETIMIREFLLYMQPKNPKIIITKLSSVYVNSYMFFQFLEHDVFGMLETARSL